MMDPGAQEAAEGLPGRSRAVVVGIGQACVDVLGKVLRFPEENTKSELLEVRRQCGGPTSTAMVTLARLGVSVAFVGSVGDDAFGRKIAAALEAEGVDASGLRVTPDRTSQFAFISVSSDTGHRTVFWHRGTAPPLTAGDVGLSRFPRARMIHMDGLMIEASLEAARQARERGMKVVMDAGTLREGSLDLLPLVDELIASEGFARLLVGKAGEPETAVRVLQAHCPGNVVVTLGERGSIGHDGRAFVRQEPFDVAVQDTTGAGDVFHGAYMVGLLEGWTMGRCMQFAGAAAALSCMHLGAQGGIPDRPTLDRFLREKTP